MDVPPETQFLLARIAPDLYCVLLPLIERDCYRAVLRAHQYVGEGCGSKGYLSRGYICQGDTFSSSFVVVCHE